MANPKLGTNPLHRMHWKRLMVERGQPGHSARPTVRRRVLRRLPLSPLELSP